MTDQEPSGLLGVGESEYHQVPLSDGLSWVNHRIEKFVQGGVYLVAGQPGIGKSTLGIQIGLDLGKQGIKTLYVLTEQSKEDLRRRARKRVSDWKPEDAQRAAEKLLESLENLSERVAASAHPSRPRAGIRAFHAAADSKIRSSAPPFRRSPFSSPNTAMSASSASAM